MNAKIKGNLLLNADIISPDMPYATLSDGLSKQTKGELLLAINYGSEMLKVYEQYREDLHYTNVNDMLRTMEDLFIRFSYQRFSLRRENLTE